jgi:hypothetical protein
MQSPEVSITTYTVGYENFQAFSLEGERCGPAEGSPAVPMVSRIYRIPNTGGMDLIIRNAGYEFVENINPIPYQEEYAATQLKRDAKTYAHDGWYPANIAEMSAPMIMRDFRVVRVTLYPVQVNPVTHQARIYHNLDVDLVANDLPGDNELTIVRRPSGEWAPMYRAAISNLDETALDDMTTTPGGYMIFTTTNAATRPKADSLAEWKTRRGYKVALMVQPSWTPTAMIAAIRNAYTSWTEQPLEYVCLMGSPVLGVPHDVNSSDHDFANMSSGDDLEDIGIGRLYGSADSQMAVILAKLMGYERTPHMESAPGVADTAWYHRSLFAACTDMNCASNYTLMQWGASQFRQFTPVTNVEAIELSDCPGIAECLPRFNEGISFFFWRGTFMQNIGAIAEQCDANWRLPVCITITCGSSSSAMTLLCAGTVANPKGAVAAMGTMGAGTHNPENITVAGGFMYNVANLGVEHAGTAAAGAKAQLFFSEQVDALDFTRINIFLGDPGLSMWTDVPELVNVTHPPSLTIGARCVEVTVRRNGDDLPIPDATVCLWKKGADSTWVVGTTDADGVILLPVSVNAAGTTLLTVTKRNHKPYLASIPCAAAVCMPTVSRYTVDDDNAGGTQGNNDGLMNPGETIDLNVYLRNFGSGTTATGVSATATSRDPRVSVLSGPITYPDIAPGDSALGNQAFRIQVSPTLPHGEVVALSFAIQNDTGPTTGLIELRCVSADLQYLRHRFPNGNFGPGLTRDLVVTIRNTGFSAINGVSGRLESLSPYVTVPVANRPFGDLLPNAVDSNLVEPFSISAHALSHAGVQVPMLLILTGNSGFVDSTRFTLSIGALAATDPIGPDAFGYYAYDNTDLNYALHPTYSYMDISSSGENLHLNDSGEKTITGIVWSTTRALPFPFTFYGRTYDTLTICSNGWVAFGDQGWNDCFRNFTIPGMQAPDAMIAPYWDDLVTQGSNLGVWARYDATGGRYIIQWKATATGSNTPLNFEVILYDSISHPTQDGNGVVLIQYNQVAMGLPNSQDHEPAGCTIGIQAPGGQVGLQDAFITTYSPGAAVVTAGRAILFTTGAAMLSGNLEGFVRDAGTNAPLAGVTVSPVRSGRTATTDANGHYRLQDLLIGNYTICAVKARFNSDTVGGILIQVDSTTMLDFSLHHPEMRFTINAIADSTADQPVQVNFDVVNDGNGPLDYASRIYFAGDENTTPWDSIGAIAVSQMTADSQIFGCEFFNNRWWVSGANGPSGQNVLYRFDARGNYVDFVPQPGTTTLGWRDLATDGEYLYGSDGPSIIQIDPQGAIVDTIPTALQLARAIAYDPSLDHFWVADSISDIYSVDRDGNVYEWVHNHGDSALSVTGLAWNSADVSGFPLYIFSRNGANRTRVSTLNPATYQIRTATNLPIHTGDVAGGCAITSNWNSALVVFAAILRNGSGSRLGIYDLAFDQSWITLSPVSAVVPGGSRQSVSVVFNPATLLNNIYRVRAYFTSNTLDTTFILPITLTVNRSVSVDPPRNPETPSEFALFQNFPNPFNSTTQIRFNVPEAAYVEVKVFNTLGQVVATLSDEMRTAGSHTLLWNGQGTGGEALASGLYVCRIKAGGYIAAKKMLLMK